MSNSSEQLDQLLSGYLDDTLDAGQRAKIESLVSSDPAVAADLAELQELRDSLRELGSHRPTTRLDDRFADRVLSAAVDRARNEGLSDSHPLIRLASQPSVGTNESSSQRGRSIVRYASIVSAIAASISIGLMLLRPNQQQAEPIALAGQASDSTVPAAVPSDPKMLAAGHPDTTPNDSPKDPGDNDSGTMADAVLRPLGDLAERASSERAIPERAVSERAVSERHSPEGHLAERNTTVPQSPTGDSGGLGKEGTPPASMPNTQSVAATGAASPDRVSSGTDAMATQLGAILVLDVRLTPEGQMSDAIRTAMERAGLDPASETDLPPGLVASLTATNEDLFADQVTVMYLTSSAKTLDRFYLNLLADSQGISAVGMSLAMNAPILKIVQSIAPDPTTIRHQSSSLELMTGGGAVDRLAGELSQLNFVPLDRQSASDLSPNGPDVPAQILVLVR